MPVWHDNVCPLNLTRPEYNMQRLGTCSKWTPSIYKRDLPPLAWGQNTLICGGLALVQSEPRPSTKGGFPHSHRGRIQFYAVDWYLFKVNPVHLKRGVWPSHSQRGRIQLYAVDWHLFKVKPVHLKRGFDPHTRKGAEYNMCLIDTCSKWTPTIHAGQWSGVIRGRGMNMKWIASNMRGGGEVWRYTFMWMEYSTMASITQ